MTVQPHETDEIQSIEDKQVLDDISHISDELVREQAIESSANIIKSNSDEKKINVKTLKISEHLTSLLVSF